MATYLETSYLEAKKVTSHHAKSFYFASIPLSPRKKQHAFAIYALCRYLDDKVDLALSIESLNIVLEELKAFVGRIFDKKLTEEDIDQHPWLHAFQDTIVACNIPEKYFLDLLKGVEMDQGPVFVQDWDELNHYCYHVAGVVGLMMTRVFQLQDRTYEKQAVDLGLAMQLTNILRDIAEDLERGRIYLPESELQSYDLSHQQLREKSVDPSAENWIDFMKFQIQRARNLYVSSEDGIAHLATDGSQYTVWLMREIYAGILDEIENLQYNVFEKRASTSLFRKCQLALHAYKKMKKSTLIAKKLDLMLTTKHHWLAHAVIHRYLISLCRKRFYSIEVKGLQHLKTLDPKLPIIGTANHTNWWDGFIVYFLSRHLPHHHAHLMMEYKQMQHYPIFRHIGAFSIDLESKMSAAKSLRYAIKQLQLHNTFLWIFPQGEMTSPHHPLKFQPGLDFIIQKTPRFQWLPIAFRYEFLREDRPQAFILIDKPQTLSPPVNISLEDHSQKLCDQLLADLASQSLDCYENIMTPKLSLNKKWEKFLFTLQGQSSIFKSKN